MACSETMLYLKCQDMICSTEEAAFVEACKQQNYLEGKESWIWTYDPRILAIKEMEIGI